VSTPLVSIIIPTYNQSGYLLHAVDSALNQDYPHLEVIVCDDASSDWDPLLLKGFGADPRLHVHRNPVNLGRVSNYRQGLYKLAKGDWVLVLDGDDFLLDPAYVSRAMQLAASDPDIDLVFSNAARLYDEHAGDLEPPRENKDLPTVMEGVNLFLKLADKGISLFHCTAIYRREKAVNLDFYRRDIISSDWESLHRYILTGKVAFLDAIASVWRIHGKNATKNISTQDRINNLQAIVEPYLAAKALGVLHPAILESWFNKRLWRAAFKDARTLLKARNTDDFRSYLRALEQISPLAARRIRRSPKLWLRRLAICLPNTAD
jgi:glycosyltransferase involved in cell wall biosynthesis